MYRISPLGLISFSMLQTRDLFKVRLLLGNILAWLPNSLKVCVLLRHSLTVFSFTPCSLAATPFLTTFIQSMRSLANIAQAPLGLFCLASFRCGAYWGPGPIYAGAYLSLYRILYYQLILQQSYRNISAHAHIKFYFS